MAPCRAGTSFDSSALQSHGDVSSPANVQEGVGSRQRLVLVCHLLKYCYWWNCRDRPQDSQKPDHRHSAFLRPMLSKTSRLTGTVFVCGSPSILEKVGGDREDAAGSCGTQLSSGNTEAAISPVADTVITHFLQQPEASASLNGLSA